MANFSYKKNTTTSLKAKGYINTNKLVINIDEVDKSLATLLSDFDGEFVEITVKLQNDEELEEPVEEELE